MPRSRSRMPSPIAAVSRPSSNRPAADAAARGQSPSRSRRSRGDQPAGSPAATRRAARARQRGAREAIAPVDLRRRRRRSRNWSSRSNPTRQRPHNLPLPATPVASPPPRRKPEPKEHSAESARPGPRTNKNSGVPFDPIKENGKIFVDWPKPKLALVITGNQEGYLEPCGCAGLDRMKGGMSRRYSLFRQLREEVRLAGRRHRRRRHRQGFWQTGRIEVPDRRQRHERDALQRRHARAVRPAPAHRRGHGPDHAGRRQRRRRCSSAATSACSPSTNRCCRGRN